MGAIIGQLILSNQRSMADDPTLSLWAVTLSTQVVQCLTIIASCVPYLKPFFHSLQSGALGNDDVLRRTTNEDSSLAKVYRYGLGSSPKQTHLSSQASGKAKLATSLGNLGHNNYRITNTTNVTTQQRDDDVVSQTSRSRMITETRTWEVDVEVQE